jgi:phytoene synthase
MRSTEIQAPYDLDACVALMRGGSKSFFAASRLLPPRVRAASIALYAFCRVADDVVDDGENPSEGLVELRERLDKIYSGKPQLALEDQALAIVVHQYKLPRSLLDALLEGFSWDAQGRSYDTMEELHDYAARVAGSVGAMMCWIMGQHQTSVLARACELGVAMQLTNIARDVGDDSKIGRLYLPHQWLRDEGIDPAAWLSKPQFDGRLKLVIKRVLHEADVLYVRGTLGIAELPRDCRAAVLAARLIYAEIGNQLARGSYNSVDSRAVVGSARKLALLGQAQLQAGWLKSDVARPAPLAAIAYLVHSCQQASGLSGRLPEGFPNRTVSERIEWMLDLFERVAAERRRVSPMTRTISRQSVTH